MTTNIALVSNIDGQGSYTVTGLPVSQHDTDAVRKSELTALMNLFNAEVTSRETRDVQLQEEIDAIAPGLTEEQVIAIARAIRLNQFATPQETLDLNSQKIGNLARGVANDDAATYGQLLDAMSGEARQVLVTVKHEGDYNSLLTEISSIDGLSGVVIDGVSIFPGEGKRVLLESAIPGESGIYELNDQGSSEGLLHFVRPAAYSVAGHFAAGLKVFVDEGERNGNTFWVVADPATDAPPQNGENGIDVNFIRWGRSNLDYVAAGVLRLAGKAFQLMYSSESFENHNGELRLSESVRNRLSEIQILITRYAEVQSRLGVNEAAIAEHTTQISGLQGTAATLTQLLNEQAGLIATANSLNADQSAAIASLRSADADFTDALEHTKQEIGDLVVENQTQTALIQQLETRLASVSIMFDGVNVTKPASVSVSWNAAEGRYEVAHNLQKVVKADLYVNRSNGEAVKAMFWHSIPASAKLTTIYVSVPRNGSYELILS